MGFFSNIFSNKPDLSDGIRGLALSIWEAVPELTKTIKMDIYKTDQELSVGTDPEIHSAFIHFVSRVSLHTGGGKFQDAIYANLRDKITETYAGVFSKYLKMSQGRNASPYSLQQEFNEVVRDREIEYAEYSGGYGDESTRKGSLIWVIANNIHKRTGVKVADDDTAVTEIGNAFVLALAELRLDKQLEILESNFSKK